MAVGPIQTATSLHGICQPAMAPVSPKNQAQQAAAAVITATVANRKRLSLRHHEVFFTALRSDSIVASRFWHQARQYLP